MIVEKISELHQLAFSVPNVGAVIDYSKFSAFVNGEVSKLSETESEKLAAFLSESKYNEELTDLFKNLHLEIIENINSTSQQLVQAKYLSLLILEIQLIIARLNSMLLTLDQNLVYYFAEKVYKEDTGNDALNAHRDHFKRFMFKIDPNNGLSLLSYCVRLKSLLEQLMLDKQLDKISYAALHTLKVESGEYDNLKYLLNELAGVEQAIEKFNSNIQFTKEPLDFMELVEALYKSNSIQSLNGCKLTKTEIYTAFRQFFNIDENDPTKKGFSTENLQKRIKDRQVAKKSYLDTLKTSFKIVDS